MYGIIVLIKEILLYGGDFMRKLENRDEIVQDVAISFITDIIFEAMKRFNIDFNTLNLILEKLNYWQVFNDNEATCVGAHEGIEPVLQRIKENL